MRRSRRASGARLLAVPALAVAAVALAACSSPAHGSNAGTSSSKPASSSSSSSSSTSTTVTYTAHEKTCISYRLVIGITAEAPQIGQQSGTDQQEANTVFQNAVAYLAQAAGSNTVSAALTRIDALFQATQATPKGGDSTELADLATVAAAIGPQCDPGPPSTATEIPVAWAVISATREDPTCFDVTDVAISTVEPNYAKADRVRDTSGQQGKSCTLPTADVLLDVSSSQQWQVLATSAKPACGDAPPAVLADLYGAAACPS